MRGLLGLIGLWGLRGLWGSNEIQFTKIVLITYFVYIYLFRDTITITINLKSIIFVMEYLGFL